MSVVFVCRGFKQDCPTGQLVKEKVLEMYSMILPAGNAAVFVEQIFRIFDKDGNGSIDFKVGLEYQAFVEFRLSWSTLQLGFF